MYKTLFETYDSVIASGMTFPEVPRYISSNLKHPLRTYQEEAVGRWLHYMDRDQVNKKIPVELLFNMATGSGKTLIMAALILDLCKRGYRNFIYFVNSKNIIEKTRDNFTNSASPKYLFADNIIIDGQKVEVRDVDSFSESDNDSINIVFTTIQGLHMDLNNPRENRLSYDEFDNKKVILIGDEAHHNNTKTLLNKDEIEDNASWEATIDGVINACKEAILLEFTATIDLDDANILNKYKKRIIYKYDLKKFREDGYSKDVMIYHVDAEVRSRMLQSIIISQYRKKVALRNGIFLKPVVMFKSRTIKENRENFELFNELISNLSVQDLKDEQAKSTSILADAFEHIGVELTDLVEELKEDFMPERLVSIDGCSVSGSDQLKLNSLENVDNEIRAVFAVDMLNEGWDVLNLFDIVRLYDTRDAKSNKPGKTTIREAQLIGRGARYFPFVINDDVDSKYIRKFDNNENEELRLIEQLHYHSAENPKYIQEIRQALITSGLIPSEAQTREMRLKKEFKNSLTYTEGVVYVNDRETITQSKMRQSSLLNDEFKLPGILEVDLPTNIGKVVSVFGDSSESNEETTVKNSIEFEYSKVIPKNITRHAIAQNKSFRFSNLKNKVALLASVDGFMAMLGRTQVVVGGINLDVKKLTPAQKLFIANKALSAAESIFEKNDETYIGTRTFEAKKISDIFKDVKRTYTLSSTDSDKEFGEPQLFARNPKYQINLGKVDWYAYDENYGTSEEKSLVKTFESLYDELSEKWGDIYLLRNEKAITIYAFDDGHAFEPDFVLLANDKETGTKSWQVFIEPKGGQLLATDKWKEDFLLQIEDNAEVLAENNDARLVGLPFYNESNNREEFIDALKDLATAKGVE